MKLHYGPNGTLMIDDARIIWTNFAGKEKGYDREGDRNFTLVFDDEDLVDSLIERGWNIKKRPGNEEGEPPFMTMKVKISVKERPDGTVTGPDAYLITNGACNKLDPLNIDCLDRISRGKVDMDIRGHDWEYQRRTGRTAWLNAIRVYQNVNRFEEPSEEMLSF